MDVWMCTYVSIIIKEDEVINLREWGTEGARG